MLNMHARGLHASCRAHISHANDASTYKGTGSWQYRSAHACVHRHGNTHAQRFAKPTQQCTCTPTGGAHVCVGARTLHLPKKRMRGFVTNAMPMLVRLACPPLIPFTIAFPINVSLHPRASVQGFENTEDLSDLVCVRAMRTVHVRVHPCQISEQCSTHKSRSPCMPVRQGQQARTCAAATSHLVVCSSFLCLVSQACHLPSLLLAGQSNLGSS